MKRATAPQAGEVHGTISGRFEHIPDASQKRLVKGRIPTQLKNFVTRQAPAATIGQLKGAEGVAGEYAYHADPYTSGQHRTAVEATEASHGRQPFKASCGGRLGGAFNKLQYEALGPSKARRATQNSLRPFKPSHAGRSSAFSADPEYMACPAPKAASAQAGKGKVDKHMPSWRPTHGSVTSATPSILVKNLRQCQLVFRAQSLL
ncbi:hypothetical protein CVIRNUC_009605 [Coccomyxa viridis]|uniref:Flagellar associated protein n=1 Tax=Coccomyxa viridis TaxID=1274662 RepID=A0AAV1IGT8_9CHLO|nr:hypothetical protein CVIRNUC_009605 [Coccomyxa viridis]